MNTEALTLNIEFKLTERAAAVLQQPPLSVAPPLQPYLLHAQLGDTVKLPPCNSTFLAVGRTWEIQASTVSLVLLLDLPPSGPTLQAV
jgi:hypothetical protein